MRCLCRELAVRQVSFPAFCLQSSFKSALGLSHMGGWKPHQAFHLPLGALAQHWADLPALLSKRRAHVHSEGSPT